MVSWDPPEWWAVLCEHAAISREPLDLTEWPDELAARKKADAEDAGPTERNRDEQRQSTGSPTNYLPETEMGHYEDLALG